jgi:hypothetical protein
MKIGAFTPSDIFETSREMRKIRAGVNPEFITRFGEGMK